MLMLQPLSVELGPGILGTIFDGIQVFGQYNFVLFAININEAIPFHALLYCYNLFIYLF